MLDVYIYDYLMKRKLHATARAFQAEGKVPTDPVAIDAPGGFLLDWWTVFWDIYTARKNLEHFEAAASYFETQMVKAQEVQQQQPEFVQNQQMQMQQMLLQRQAQQQQQIRDSMDAAMKSRLSDNVGQMLDPNHASLLLGQTLHCMPGGSGYLREAQNRNQQLHVSTQYQGVDQLELQRIMQSQLEQQLIQQSIQSQSVDDLEHRNLRMLLNHQNMNIGKDISVSAGNFGSSMQVNSPLLLRDIDQLIKLHKQQRQLQNSQQQQQYALSFINDQASKSPTVRNRKQHVMSSSNELADIDRFVDDITLHENVGSFFSHDAADFEDRVVRSVDIGAFSEIRHIQASTNKIESCHFSSDGKLLATGGNDKKATLWCTESFTPKSTLEGHSQRITDIRFCPSISLLATSSSDKTVRVWDADNAGRSLRRFKGHSTTVISVDFHPGNEDLICSCDNNSEIRYWSIQKGSCTGGGASKARFQPRHGRILAAAAENVVSMLDVETQVCSLKLQGHKHLIHSVCWDPSGEFLASLSDELVRVWTAVSGNKAKRIHELSCTGYKFRSCVFHPSYSHLLIIGCYQTLKLWNMAENRTMTFSAHEKLVSSLAASNVSGLVASASHDKCVKLWK